MKKIMVILFAMLICACPAVAEQVLDLPDNLTLIAEEAFMNDASVTEVRIPGTVTEIGARAFKGCGLESAFIPVSVKSVGDNAFDMDVKLIITEGSPVLAWAEDAGYTVVEVPPVEITAPASVTLGQAITWTADTAGLGYDGSYRWEITGGGETVHTAEYVNHDSITWLPTAAGTYAVTLTCDGYAGIQGPEVTVGERSATAAKYFKYGYPSKSKTDRYVITGYTGSDPNVIVPAKIDGKPVVTVSLCNNSKIETVILPENGKVSTLYLYGNDNLKAANIPASVTKLVASAMYDNPSLVSVRFAEGLTALPEGCFYDCPALAEVDLPSTLTSVGKSAFMGCDALTSLDIPEAVTDIGEYAFTECAALKRVNLPAALTKIGMGAFMHCPALETVDVPASCALTAMGDFAFSHCYDLKAFDLPAGVKTIPESAFSHCASLARFTVAENSVLETIGEFAFYGCAELSRISLPDSLTTVREAAFVGCEWLSMMTLPDNISEIGKDAFFHAETLYCGAGSVTARTLAAMEESFVDPDCSDYELMLVPGGLSVVGYRGSDTANVPAAIDGVAVLSIGESAFYNAFTLETLVLPEGLTAIEDRGFYNCASLKSVTLPSTLTTIGLYGFGSCEALTGITLPDNLTLIDQAFNGCNNLDAVYCKVGTASATALTAGNSWLSFIDPEYPDYKLFQYVDDDDGSLYLFVDGFTNEDVIDPVYPTEINGIPVRTA